MAYHSASAKLARNPGLAGIPASIQDIETAIGDIDAWQRDGGEGSLPAVMERLKGDLKGVNDRLRTLGDADTPAEAGDYGHPDPHLQR